MAYQVVAPNTPTLNQNFTVNDPAYSVGMSSPATSTGTGTWDIANPQTAGMALQPNLVYDSALPVQPVSPQYYYQNGQTATSAQAAQDAADTAGYYQDQIDNLNGQNGRLDSFFNVANSNIDNSYNQSHNRMDAQYAKAQGNYNDQTQANTTQYSKNRSAIQSQTANRANALQRLLGIAGAGNSSASYEQAPYAASLQGTQQLGEAQTGFATNGRNLDKSWQDTTDSYNNGLVDLNNDAFAKRQSAQQQRDQQRASLLSQIQQLGQQRDMAKGASYTTARANQAGYQTQINNLLNGISSLGSQFSQPVALQTANVGYNAPSLLQYSLKNGTNAANIQGSNPGTSDVNPTFNPLLNQQRDEFGNLIG
jgi:hypothetical protein